jgi:hypothetical protein
MGPKRTCLLLQVQRPIVLLKISHFLTLITTHLLTHDNADPLAILYGHLNGNSDAKDNTPQRNASLASPLV